MRRDREVLHSGDAARGITPRFLVWLREWTAMLPKKVRHRLWALLKAPGFPW